VVETNGRAVDFSTAMRPATQYEGPTIAKRQRQRMERMSQRMMLKSSLLGGVADS